MSSRHAFESRPSQTARIVDLLRSRSPHWVSLPEILELRISQYSARIHQARRRWGLNIENKIEAINGKKHFWFRLVERPAQTPVMANRKPPLASTPGFPQFGELARESYGVD